MAWPDHEDVIRVLKTIPEPKPTPESIYPDVALAHHLLRTAYERCRNYGRHEFQPLAAIKIFVEDFIGHEIDGIALQIAIRMTGIPIKSSSVNKSVLLVKVPQLDRFEEVRDLWNQSRIAEQKEIDQEIKDWAKFRARFPNYRP